MKQLNFNLEIKKLLYNKKYYVKYNRQNNIKFEKNYHGIVKDPDGKLRNLKNERKFKLSQIKYVLQYIKKIKPGKVLDVGCGYGWLLSALNNKWKKYGVEISKHAGVFSKKFGKIHIGKIEEYHERKFDLITALHVIEHINKPEIFILKLKKILNKQGILILETPDFDSAAARRYGKKFRLLFDKTHISLFSQDSLIRFVRDHGFEVLDINYPYFETSYFTRKNILKIFNKKTVSPPFYGSVITLFLKKK